ncbi:MAG: aminomethyl-transferring glycine dehydrogenase subunit GcvPA [bacterium]
MRYSGLTPATRAEMLRAIGAPDVEALFASIPAADRMQRPLAIHGPVPEAQLWRDIEAMGIQRPRVALVGGGLYSHFIPAALERVVARSEWLTSYTPYQPEIAQGTCVMYYEFQTYSAMLTGQEIANAGMYDGSTALAEAVLMAKRLRPKAHRLYVAGALHPEYLAVLRTYLSFQDGIEIVELPVDPASGRTRFEVSAADQASALAVVVQSPNFFGVVEDTAGLAANAFTIWCATEAMSLALLPPVPCQIAVGEIQSFGIPVQLGGPTSGYFATKKENVRQLPGRLIGRTVDADGKEAYCITLATREQFIRRDRATSNICTASGLMCLRAVTYLSLMGRRGLEDVARQNAKAAHYVARGLAAAGIELPYDGPFFNEFVIDLARKPGLHESLAREGFVLGVPLARFYPADPAMRHRYLVNVTELHYPDAQAIVEEVRRHAIGR